MNTGAKLDTVTQSTGVIVFVGIMEKGDPSATKPGDPGGSSSVVRCGDS